LVYLVEKTGSFLPPDLRRKVEVMQWLFWQMGGLGPMAGQSPLQPICHRKDSLTPSIAMSRETNRLYGVLNKRLADREFAAGEYSIADMAAYPWIVSHERQGQKLEDFPHLKAMVRDDQGAAGHGAGV
jgi:GST-like protein